MASTSSISQFPNTNRPDRNSARGVERYNAVPAEGSVRAVDVNGKGGYRLYKLEHVTTVDQILPEVLRHPLSHARIRNSARMECNTDNALCMVL